MATTVRLRHIYLALCVVGTLLPYSQVAPWLVEHGLDLPLFFHQLSANRIGAFFGFAVFVSALSLWVFVFAEGLRLNMQRLWLPVVASVTVGVSLGLPLFLYMRHLRTDRTAV